MIIETAGFGIFKNEENLALIKKLAAKTGIIIMTDADGAGFRIRSHLSSAIPKDQIIHVYTPDFCDENGGKLGVESLSADIIRDALNKAGVTHSDRARGNLTTADLYSDGLTGCPQSKILRRIFLKQLSLPELLSTSALIDTINILMTQEEYKEAINSAKEEYAEKQQMRP